MTLFKSIFNSATIAALVSVLLLLSVQSAHAEESYHEGENAQILQEFNKQHREDQRAKSITDKDKQRIMFLLGISLLTLVLITGGLGIAMGLFGKQVFVAHMIFAGLSMTLAIVHAIVGIVWFFPY